MYNSKHKIQIYRDLNLRQSANVAQPSAAKSKDLFSSERFGPDVLASNTIAHDREDHQDSSIFTHHMEQRKYTLERAKAHYRHVNTKFTIDH